jgi:HK97 family phage major capsid protein
MNLKKYLDAVNTAEARVQQIAAQIDEHFEADETDKALAMKPQLDEAKAKAKEAHELYLSLLDMGQQLTPVGGDVQVVRDAADQPWASGGEFFKAVKQAAMYPGRTDPRLLPLKDATGLSEGVPADGGYLVIPQYSAGILERMYTNGEILRRCAQDPVTGNSMSYNAVDETSRAAGSRYGGVTTYWVGEGGTITPSKPKFRQIDLKLKKAAALVYATEEQLEDIANLESWIGRIVPDELLFAVEDTIFNGDGVGKPLGILNAPSLLTLLRVDASEIDATDIANLWSHRFPGLRDYVWFIDASVFPQLVSLTVGQMPVYLPGGLYSAVPYGTIFGAPVVETEHNQALGTAGDILLASLSQYQTITKGGVKARTSVEVAFLTDEVAYRFTYRIDGEPTWNSTLTTTSGTSCSPFVVLGASV